MVVFRMVVVNDLFIQLAGINQTDRTGSRAVVPGNIKLIIRTISQAIHGNQRILNGFGLPGIFTSPDSPVNGMSSIETFIKPFKNKPVTIGCQTANIRIGCPFRIPDWGIRRLAPTSVFHVNSSSVN